MKHIYIIIALFFLVGCEHEPLLSDEAVAVRLIPSLNDRAPGDTRVVDQEWRTGDLVGVSIDDGNAYNGKDYKMHNPSASAATVELKPQTGQTIYYPVDGNNVAFRAFCPYKTPDGNDLVGYTFTNQSDLGEMQKVDLVYHQSATKAYNKGSGAVNMLFQHRFSKVVINVTRGAGVSEVLTDQITMTLTKVPTSAKFNVSTGALGAVETPGPITTYRSASDATTATAMAIVPPHSSGSNFTGRTVTFKVGGLNYSYPIPDTFTFAAEKVYTFNFILTPTAPILTSTAVVAWNSGTIAWDSENKHSLTAPAEVILSKEATTGNTIVIKTNHTGTPTIQYSTSATSVTGSATVTGWLKNPVLSGPTGNPNEWTLTYDVTAASADREGYIHTSIKDGGIEVMKVVTKVTQSISTGSTGSTVTPIYVSGDANCFIVPPGSAIVFPLTRPISVGTATSSSAFTVTPLWDDTDGGAVSDVSVINDQGKNAHVVVFGKKPGNALIAVEVNSEIVWSYHIWVTDYDPYAATYTNPNNGFIFMDRNLGATDAGFGNLLNNDKDNYGLGLFYQWGRKDPFPATGNPDDEQPGGGKFTAEPTSADLGTVANTIKHPDVFYFCTYVLFAPCDWHYNSRDNDLWGHLSNKKTIYDPCPAGWCVPKNSGMSDATSPWAGFNTFNGVFTYGYTWDTNAVYPNASLREFDTGNIDNMAETGLVGSYWSASPRASSGTIGNNASALTIGHAGGANVHDGKMRSFGFSVRCVRE